MPLPDEAIDLLLLCDEMEKHPNPVALLREARRVLAPGKPMIIISKRKPLREEAATDVEHRYRWQDLVRQVASIGNFEQLSDLRQDDVRRDMVLIVKRAQEVATVRVGAA